MARGRALPSRGPGTGSARSPAGRSAGSPTSVLNDPGGCDGGAEVLEQGGDQVLGRRLARGAGDRDDPGVGQRRERVAGQPAQGGDRVRDHDRGRPRGPGAEGDHRAGGRAPPRRSRDRRPGRRRSRRTGRPGRPDASRPPRPSPDARVGAVDEPAADRRGDAPRGPSAITCRPSRAARSSARSSNGVTTPATSCPCSWPLPSTSTAVPGAGHAARPVAMAARLSASSMHLRALGRPATSRAPRHDGGPDRRRRLGARVVVGDDQATSALAGGDSGPSAGACRGRGRRPQPSTDDHPAARHRLAGGGERPRDGVRACARSRRRQEAAGRRHDALHPAGHARRSPPTAAAADLAGPPRVAPPRRARPGAFATLNRPGRPHPRRTLRPSGPRTVNACRRRARWTEVGRPPVGGRAADGVGASSGMPGAAGQRGHARAPRVVDADQRGRPRAPAVNSSALAAK